VNEVILRLLAIEDTERIQNPLAYARIVLKNLIRDLLRRQVRTQRVLAALAAASPETLYGQEEKPALEDSEAVEYLLRNTDLSPLQSKVLRLVYLNGQTVSEVARELSRNPGTVQRHLDRALEKLAHSAAALEIGT
jgi:RNA polymerase sigma factor (sigma-70 family)